MMGALLLGLLDALGFWLSPRLDRFFGRLFDRPLRWAHQKLGHLPTWLRLSIFFAASLAVLVTVIALLMIGLIWLFGALLWLLLLVLGVPQD